MNQHRTFLTEARASKDGAIEVSFSSEAPVDIDGVREVLDHSPSAVDLRRLNNSAPVLFEHTRDRVIGVVEKAWVTDGKGRASIRFGTTALATDVAKDVAAGIRRNISVGYRVIKHAIRNGVRHVTQWEPFEISVVAIPADISVGFGRSRSITNTKVNPGMKLKSLRETRGAKLKTIHEFKYAGDVPSAEETSTLRELHDDVTRLDEAIGLEQRTLNSAARQSDLRERSRPIEGFPAVVDGEHEYSLLRALRLQAANKLDGLELEVHQELSRTMPDAPRGVVVPAPWNFQRDLTATGQTSVPGDQGGQTIPTLIGPMMDPHWNAQVLRRLGATFFTGLSGNLDLPRGNATVVGWEPENDTVGESTPVIASVQLRPHRVGSFVDVSNQLLMQNSVDIENWVRRNLTNSIMEEWQRVAINGSGTAPEPRGIINTSAIGGVAMGTNGGAPSWAKLVELEGSVFLSDAAEGSLGFLVNSKTRAKLKNVLRNPVGTDSGFIWGTDNRLLGYNAGVTNGVPDNLTKGTSSGVCSAIIFGNFADLIMASWGRGVDIIVDPYTGARVGLTMLIANAYLDAAVRKPDSFSVIKDALTT